MSEEMDQVPGFLFFDHVAVSVKAGDLEPQVKAYKAMGFKEVHREDVLGTDGTISRGQQIRYLPQKVNRPDGIEMLGQTGTPPRAHMENFLDSIRTGKPVNCPFDIGFRVSVACCMAIESFYAGRTVRWDAAREEIV